MSKIIRLALRCDTSKDGGTGSLYIFNDGTAALTVTDITSDNAHFFVRDTDAVIPAGGATVMPVDYGSSAAGATVKLTVASDKTSGTNTVSHTIDGSDATTVLADVTITAADLPTYAASANASTDVVTLTGYNPSNGDTFYIEGGTPPAFSGVSQVAFQSEFVGPVFYAVNSSGNTCKLAATRGGAALDITDAGSGWTMRLAGTKSVLVSGLTAAERLELLVDFENGYGWTTTGSNSNAFGIRINSDSGAVYKTSTSESTSFLLSGFCNVWSKFTAHLWKSGKFVFGDACVHGLWGSDPTNANSTPVQQHAAVSLCYYNPTSANVSTLTIWEAGSGQSNPFFKLGTRVQIRRYN